MKNIYILSLIFFLGSNTYAQTNCEGQISSLIISTGYDPNMLSIVNDYDFDPMWRLVQAPPDPVGWTSNIGGPAIAIPTSTSWNEAGLTSKYINAYPTASALTDNWSLTTIPYIFQREFCICTDDPLQAPVNVTFDLAMQADNWAEVYLEDFMGNQTLLLTQPYIYQTANFQGAPDVANVTLSLNPGEYKLKLYHRNKLVVMGVSLEGTITSSSLLSDKTCSPRGHIAGYMYEDVNSTGLIDGGDAKIPYWVMNLYDAGNNLIETATTDHSGYYFFMDKNAEGYTVKAQNEVGWNILLPATGSQDLYTDTNYVNHVDFLAKNVSGSQNLIEEMSQNQFKVYPNPSNGQITIEFLDQGTEDKAVQITDNMGKILYDGLTDQQFHSVNLSSFSAGIYFVHIHKGDKTLTQKISIE